MMFSSASEGDNTDTDGVTHRSIGSRRSKKSAVTEEKLPRLVETLALCYLGTLLLKIPVTVEDFHRWALQDRITYNRAVRTAALLFGPLVLISLQDQRSSKGDEIQTPCAFPRCA